jgi:hypothetical protein
MSPSTGLTLRLVGPLIEVICLGLMFGLPARDIQFHGVALQTVLYGGVALGLLLVIAGLTLVRRPRRTPLD